jgi:integrase
VQFRHQLSLSPLSWDSLQWTSARVPTLASLEPLRLLLPEHVQLAICSTAIPSTAVELADCRGIPDWLCDKDGEENSLDTHAQLFDSQILPAAQAQRTRASYFSNWRAFVTYAFIHDCLSEVLPASTRLIKAYLWFLLQAGFRPGTITLHLYAIIDRHTRHGYVSPVHRHHVKSWIKAFERLCGVPKRDKLALTSTHLKAILAAPRSTLCQLRDTLIVGLGTTCAMRVSEILQLDACDVLFEFEPGVMALRIKKRKNDQKRAGLWPRIGHASSPRFDLIHLTREWLRRADIAISSSCEKERHPRSSCRFCGRLFSRIMGSGDRIFPIGHRLHGIISNTVADAIHSSLNRVGYNSTEFSGISMRRGGLTTALTGGVPSDLYALQSGHVSDSWKNYVHPGQERKLLLFYESFQL